MDSKKLLSTIFDTTVDLLDSGIASEEQIKELREITPFIEEDLGNQRTVITYLDDLIERKVVNEVINRVKLLKKKGLLKGVYKSFRYGTLEKKQVIIWFFYLTEKYQDWSDEWVNEYIFDDGPELDPDDQDWI